MQYLQPFDNPALVVTRKSYYLEAIDDNMRIRISESDLLSKYDHSKAECYNCGYNADSGETYICEVAEFNGGKFEVISPQYDGINAFDGESMCCRYICILLRIIQHGLQSSIEEFGICREVNGAISQYLPRDQFVFTDMRFRLIDFMEDVTSLSSVLRYIMEQIGRDVLRCAARFSLCLYLADGYEFRQPIATYAITPPPTYAAHYKKYKKEHDRKRDSKWVKLVMR